MHLTLAGLCFGYSFKILAGDIGTTSSYVKRIVKKKEGVINKTFVQMMEALGYDIELTYTKRNKEGGGNDGDVF
ncbi:MAG: XRE family transcriptional regulator [Lachnospiraceae bacterium]|nr:XRE family transcriptional regulator [Lachnospiraceae bacterium]